MTKRIYGTLAMVIAWAMLISMLTSCGSSGGDGPFLHDIPLYPNSTDGESMEQSGPGGFGSGKLAQYTTFDSFDEVVNFYTEALNAFSPKSMSHTSELGRQTALSIPKKKGMLSVAIQELTEEEKVNITFMEVGM
jgi:hypothetical protein